MKKRIVSLPSTFVFGGLNLFAGSVPNVVALCNLWIQKRERGYVCVTSVHGVTEALNDKNISEAYHRARLIVPDGMPLVWIGRAQGFFQTKRIYGPDLMRSMCHSAERLGYKIFLYGTTQDTQQKLIATLRRDYPRLRFAGFYAPPFRPLTPTERREVIATIVASGAQIVFVGLSTPKQELWMKYFAPRLNANVLIGVGAAFDFLAGTKKQAPVWIRRAGGEWLYRLVHEPRRLWRRYAMSLMVFIRLLILQTVRAIIPKS